MELQPTIFRAGMHLMQIEQELEAYPTELVKEIEKQLLAQKSAGCFRPPPFSGEAFRGPAGNLGATLSRPMTLSELISSGTASDQPIGSDAVLTEDQAARLGAALAMRRAAQEKRRRDEARRSGIRPLNRRSLSPPLLTRWGGQIVLPEEITAAAQSRAREENKHRLNSPSGGQAAGGRHRLLSPDRRRGRALTPPRAARSGREDTSLGRRPLDSRGNQSLSSLPADRDGFVNASTWAEAAGGGRRHELGAACSSGEPWVPPGPNPHHRSISPRSRSRSRSQSPSPRDQDLPPPPIPQLGGRPATLSVPQRVAAGALGGTLPVGVWGAGWQGRATMDSDSSSITLSLADLSVDRRDSGRATRAMAEVPPRPSERQPPPTQQAPDRPGVTASTVATLFTLQAADAQQAGREPSAKERVSYPARFVPTGATSHSRLPRQDAQVTSPVAAMRQVMFGTRGPSRVLGRELWPESSSESSAGFIADIPSKAAGPQPRGVPVSSRRGTQQQKPGTSRAKDLRPNPPQAPSGNLNYR